MLYPWRISRARATAWKRTLFEKYGLEKLSQPSKTAHTLKKNWNVCVVSEGWLNFLRPNFSNSVCFQAVALALDILQEYSMRAFGGWLGWLAFSRNSRRKKSNVCVVLGSWLHFSRLNFSDSVRFQALAIALETLQNYCMCAFDGWLGWLAFSRKSRAKFF